MKYDDFDYTRCRSKQKSNNFRVGSQVKSLDFLLNVI